MANKFKEIGSDWELSREAKQHLKLIGRITTYSWDCEDNSVEYADIVTELGTKRIIALYHNGPKVLEGVIPRATCSENYSTGEIMHRLYKSNGYGIIFYRGFYCVLKSDICETGEYSGCCYRYENDITCISRLSEIQNANDFYLPEFKLFADNRLEEQYRARCASR